MGPDSDPADALAYVAVVGHGRSGSNLALDILDQHPNTFCRNEPNELADSALSHLPSGMGALGTNGVPLGAWRKDAWSRAIATSAKCHGVRDRKDRLYKGYYRSPAHRFVAETILTRSTLRRYLQRHTQEEWDVSSFLDRSADRPPVPVFKVLLQPEWFVNAQKEIQTQHLLHVIRDPTGFIRSWYNRYVQGAADGNAERVFNKNMTCIDAVLDFVGGQMRSKRTYSLEALVETELWRWRYVNERLLCVRDLSDRYTIWHFETLQTNPLGLAQDLMPRLGLSIDKATEKRISRLRNTLFNKPHTHTLDEMMVSELVDHVMDGSALPV